MVFPFLFLKPASRATPSRAASEKPEAKRDVASASAAASSRELKHAAEMAAVPELAPLGTPFKSNAPVELTESETEYVVKCVKHVFDKVVVFQVGSRGLSLQDTIIFD